MSEPALSALMLAVIASSPTTRCTITKIDDVFESKWLRRARIELNVLACTKNIQYNELRSTNDRNVTARQYVRAPCNGELCSLHVLIGDIIITSSASRDTVRTDFVREFVTS